MKRLLLILFTVLIISSCGSGGGQGSSGSGESSNDQTNANISSYDPNRGEGKYSSVELGATLNTAMAENGSKIQAVKCSACHKLTAEKLVGPGWKGVTERRKPEWIMNFITNPDPMIDKDPVVQAQFELCLIRMPNQALTDEDARHVLEFMRKNDGLN